MILTREEKLILLGIARKGIEVSLLKKRSLKEEEKLPAGSPDTSCGAFVSLYVDGELRGCMGTFSESEKLSLNVRRMAQSAATSDRRFEPIASGDIDDLEIEISVLSPRKKIKGPDEIQIGKHGIFMQKDGFRGTLLPQVALNQNWTAEEFLGHCAKYKAGLGWDEWTSAEVYTYEAIVFSSKEII